MPDNPDSSDHNFLDTTPGVRAALREGRAVVALESTIICHGMPYPKNVEAALAVEAAVREHGAVPATIAVLGGRLKLGVNAKNIKYLGEKGRQIIKCSRRDLPLLVAGKRDGACTVAATMIAAALAGIRVLATGGIGGVHRGAENTMDISADLEELARTNVAVVCAGVKSVLDIGRTLEYLETVGVAVIGYRTDSLPAFYARDSGYAVDYRVDSAQEIADVMHAKWALQLAGGVVIANPVAEEYALDRQDIDGVIAEAIDEMNRTGVTGKDTTPYLLARIGERTEGRSLDANIQLVLNNARLAADVAVELANAG